MKNIVLIGMPGCGKSTVGVVLAKILGYRFLDSDLVIQEQEDRLLSDIIEQEGVDGFNEIENRINASINVRKTVIATGGSVVYGKDAMEHFKDIGIIVYIKLPYDDIKHRLGDLAKRGVSIKEGQTLRDLYNERLPLYEKYADIIADERGLTISQTAMYIKEQILSRYGGRKNDNKQG
ncbi:MAG: shikimate kinase [Clostridia bacterium]|nr:shikimate kinase [Clostridia bacterium]